MKCPHCQTELEAHVAPNSAKDGAQHCYDCGCCFQPDGKTIREGTPVCALAATPAPVAEAEPEAEETEETEEEDTESEPTRTRSTRRTRS